MSSILVAAIDLGTTLSGYAFSFLHEYYETPLNISAIKWNSRMGPLTTEKTSTCVLFDKDRKFHSFGYEAEDKYSSLASDNKHHDWYYFRRFKMMLYDRKVQEHFLSFISSFHAHSKKVHRSHRTSACAVRSLL